MSRRLRILTWHVHGNYLWNLSQLPHDLYLVTDRERSPGRVGRVGALPWGPQVHEAPIDDLAAMPFDVVLFQSRSAWEDDQHRWLSAAQRRGPRIYLEHDPPQQHPTDTRHWVDDPEVLLVQVTPYNALMWDAGRTPVRVIEHGVRLLADVRWHGTLARGLVVVNHLQRRGRRLGRDLVEAWLDSLPLAVAGMGSTEAYPEVALGDVPQADLPAVMAAHRFFLHPARYTSLGLALIEAMLIGQPVVGLATTELSTVIRNGENGWIDTRAETLADVMRELLRDPGLAAAWGEAGRRTARERFGIDRFVADWDRALQQVVG